MRDNKSCCSTDRTVGTKEKVGCCGSNEETVTSGGESCPECGKLGWNVPLTAVKNLLTEPSRLEDANNYYICTNQACKVVYYNPNNGQKFYKDSVKVKVWLKESGDDVPLCYCNQITRGEIKGVWQKGARTYNEVVDITRGAKVKCNCKYENPSGRCCSTVINEFLEQLKENSKADKASGTLEIEFLYLDLSVCNWCQDTETNLDDAISETANILKATGVDVTVRKIHVQSEEQARELRFVSSPTIRVNENDIQLDVKESQCESCGDLCGEDVDCRIWVYQGKEYTAPPKAMIIEAILREVYGNNDNKPKSVTRNSDVPDNLKRFFAAKRKKESGESINKNGSCCGTPTKSDKSSC